jgi:phage shock protein C
MLIGDERTVAPRAGPGRRRPPTGRAALRRSASDKVLAGVCGGLGRYLGVDPILLRVAVVVLTLANGIGVIAYVIAWIVIPEERPGQPVAAAPAPRQETNRLVLGGALVVLGVVVVASGWPALGRRT